MLSTEPDDQKSDPTLPVGSTAKTCEPWRDQDYQTLPNKGETSSSTGSHWTAWMEYRRKKTDTSECDCTSEQGKSTSQRLLSIDETNLLDEHFLQELAERTN